jgi:hypothetical protein
MPLARLLVAMSYCSKNSLPPATRIEDVRAFLALLGYEKNSGWVRAEGVSFLSYDWFDETDYRSWSGVELSIDQRDGGGLFVSTRTPVSRSYYDLEQQNRTIAALRKRFGGSFSTDAGVGRYQKPNSGPPPPAVSGCHLAFARFGTNLIRSVVYLDNFGFSNHAAEKSEKALALYGMSPKTLSGNMLLAFAISIVEDYLKSCFIAMLRYSPNKERLLKGVRLRGDQLARVSNGEESIEQAVAETFSFQRISAASRTFESLEGKLDIAATLRKPFNRCAQSLFDSLEALVIKRNAFVHRADIDQSVTDVFARNTLHDLDVAMTRVQKAILKLYDWPFEKTWHIGHPVRGRAAKRSQEGLSGGG